MNIACWIFVTWIISGFLVYLYVCARSRIKYGYVTDDCLIVGKACIILGYIAVVMFVLEVAFIVGEKIKKWRSRHGNVRNVR